MALFDLPEKNVTKLAVAVPLVTLRDVSAGENLVGEEIPLMVASDVIDQLGRRIIRKGAPASAVITFSRGQRGMDRVLNRPSRLRVRLLAVIGEDGTARGLCGSVAQPDAEIPLVVEPRELLALEGRDRALWMAVSAESERGVGSLTLPVPGFGPRRNGDAAGQLLSRIRPRTALEEFSGLYAPVLGNGSGLANRLRGVLKGQPIRVRAGNRITAYLRP